MSAHALTSPKPLVTPPQSSMRLHVLCRLVRERSADPHHLRALEYLFLGLSTQPSNAPGARRLLPEEEIDVLLAECALPDSPDAGPALDRYLKMTEAALATRQFQELVDQRVLEQARAFKYELGVRYYDREVVKASIQCLLVIERMAAEPGYATQEALTAHQWRRGHLPPEEIPAAHAHHPRPPRCLSSSHPLPPVPRFQEEWPPQEPIPLKPPTPARPFSAAPSDAPPEASGALPFEMAAELEPPPWDDSNELDDVDWSLNSARGVVDASSRFPSQARTTHVPVPQESRDRSDGRAADRRPPAERASDEHTSDERTADAPRASERTADVRRASERTAGARTPDTRTTDGREQEELPFDEHRPEERHTGERRVEERRREELPFDEHRPEERRTGERRVEERRREELQFDEHRPEERRTGERRVEERRREEPPFDEHRPEERRTGERRVEERRTGERRVEERRTDERRVEERRTGERRVEERRTGERRVEERRTGERRAEAHTSDDHGSDERRSEVRRSGEHTPDEHRSDVRRSGERRLDEQRHEERRHDDRRHEERRHEERRHEERRASTGRDASHRDSLSASHRQRSRASVKPPEPRPQHTRLWVGVVALNLAITLMGGGELLLEPSAPRFDETAGYQAYRLDGPIVRTPVMSARRFEHTLVLVAGQPWLDLSMDARKDLTKNLAEHLLGREDILRMLIIDQTGRQLAYANGDKLEVSPGTR